MTTTEAVCLACGSPHITWLEDCGPTGVVAPDGGAEYRSEAGVYCLECGAIEDEPEFREVEEEIMTQTVTIRDAGSTMPAPQPGLSREQIQLLKDTICKGATDEELRLFVEVCKRKNLDPFSKQIHPVRRWDSALRREVMTFQTGIDGLRLAAERSGRYEGQTKPLWCGADGKWREVWLDKNPPAAATVGIYRAGFREPMFATATYAEYVQTTKEGGPNSMWRKMPSNQLIKCAESLALRKCFPEELSGLFSAEEMGQADRDPDPPHAAPPAHAPRGQEGPDRPWKTYKGMVEEFGKLKLRLESNEGLYYSVLSDFGVKHANEFKNLPNATENATAAYFKLLDRVREYEAAIDASEEYEVGPEPEVSA